MWRLEEGLPALIADCRRLLDAKSRFLFLTVYAVRMSALAIGELVRQAFADLPGTVEAGELARARGSARAGAADRDLRAVEPLALKQVGAVGCFIDEIAELARQA